ncbi:reverse transcriptase domain-containing protein [Tanacetum coccineum]
MRAFICEFRTTNEILFKERNNSLSELRFEVQELLKVINNTPMTNFEIKGVTTRGRKSTTHDVQNNSTNIHAEEPLMVNHDKPVESNEVLDKDQSKTNQTRHVIQTSSEGLEKSINQSDLKSYECFKSKADDDSDLRKPIRRIDSLNTPYSVARETTRPDEVESEHLYSASANEIDEKKPELKNLPHHLEYAYLHGEKSFPIIVSSKLSEKEKMLLLILPDSDHTRRSKKTTFTCPYGTFAYRRMPFGLCNAPATFQRCMTAIFHDMVEDFMEVFVDDFLVFGIEVDRAKIDVIAKLPYPTNVKGVRSFLGHFDFSNDCKKAFNILKEKLTTTPIIISPDWNAPFEIICDASDFAGVVLGQRIDGKFKPIYYASKTLNNAQEHYTTTEKELLAAVFSFDKFCPYLILSKTVVYTDHSALKYVFKNLAADHLLRLKNQDLGTFMEEEIADEFPDEHLMILKAKLNDDEPWLCPDNVMRRCNTGSEILEILAHCHSGQFGGHHSASITGRKVFESGFFWPSIFKDAKDYVMRCDACQRSGNISSRSEIPQNNIQVGYGKACHLPVEIEHRAYWALKQCNMDLTAAAKNCFMELNERIELRDGAYENTRIYDERTKKWHNSRLREDKNFNMGDKVLLFNSRFKMHSGKLKSKDLQEEAAPAGEQSGPPAPKTAKQLTAKRNQERVKSILLLAIPDEYLLKNLAFLSSENTSSTNEVSTANGNFRVNTAGGTSSTSQGSSTLALVAQDSLGGYDWSNDFDKPVNYDLMAISSSSSSSSSDNKVQNCSKQCLESFKTLQKNFDSEREKHSRAKLEIQGYELALESLESRILGHEKNELAWGEKYEFQTMNLSAENEISMSVFEVRSSDEEITPANDRFSKADGYHVVPPPITGNFLTPRADISFAVHESVVSKPKINRDKVIIEDWNSDDEDDVSAVKTVSLVKTNETQTVRN